MVDNKILIPSVVVVGGLLTILGTGLYMNYRKKERVKTEKYIRDNATWRASAHAKRMAYQQNKEANEANEENNDTPKSDEFKTPPESSIGKGIVKKSKRNKKGNQNTKKHAKH